MHKFKNTRQIIVHFRGDGRRREQRRKKGKENNKKGTTKRYVLACQAKFKLYNRTISTTNVKKSDKNMWSPLKTIHKCKQLERERPRNEPATDPWPGFPKLGGI